MRAMLPFVEVLVGIHLFLPLLYLGVFAADLEPGLLGTFVVVVGFLRAKGSPAPVRLAVPLCFEWARPIWPVLWAGER